MRKDVNKCFFIGRLGRDPEVRYSGEGRAFAKFSIACNDDYKKGKEIVEHTNWIPVVASGRLAEIVDKYLKKGSQVYIEGKFTVRKFSDKNTGADRWAHEVILNHMQMLDKKESSPTAIVEARRPDFDDDIPF